MLLPLAGCILFLKLAWLCRIGIFPYHFVCDPATGRAGYYFRGNWHGAFAVTDSLYITFEDEKYDCIWTLENTEEATLFSGIEPDLATARKSAEDFTQKIKDATGKKIRID